MSINNGSDLPPRERRRRRKTEEPDAKPAWELGFSGGIAEKLASLLVIIIALLALWADPGFNRPLRHLPLLLSGLATCASAFFLFRQRLNSKSILTLGALACWWLLSCVSCFQTIDVFRTKLAFTSWTSCAGLFLLASLAITSGRTWRSTVTTLSAGILIYCLYALLFRVPGQPLRGNFTNQDTFSYIPMVGAYLALSLFLGTGASRAFGIITVAVCCLTVLATGSRAGAVGLLTGALGWWGALALGRDKLLLKRSTRRLGYAVVLLFLLGTATGAIPSLLRRVSDVSNGKDIQGVTMRLDVLNYGLETSRKYPLLGSGPGTFAQAYQQFRPRGVVPDYIFVNYAHNDYIEMLVEVGWPAFLLWLIFCSLVIIRGIRLIRYSIATWECSCLIGAVVATAAFTTLNFALPTPVLFQWEMLVLALLHGLPSTGGQTEPISPLQRMAALLVFLLGLGCVEQSTRNLMAGRLLKQSQVVMDAMRWEDAIETLDQAIAWQPVDSEALRRRGKLMVQLGFFTKNKERQKLGEESLTRAAKLSPRDSELAMTRIDYYRSKQDNAEAEKVLLELCKNAPYRQRFRDELIKVQILEDKLLDAARTLFASYAEDEGSQKILPEVLYHLAARSPQQARDLLGEWGSQEGETASSLLLAKKAARRALTDNELSAAQTLVNYVLEKDAADSEALYQRSQIAGRTGKVTERLQILQKLSKKAEVKVEDEFIDAALVDLAREHHLNPLSAEMRALEQRLKAFPKSTNLRILIVDTNLAQRKLDTASELLAAGLDIQPEEPKLLIKMGDCLMLQGLPDLAKGYYEQAVKVSPNNQEARRGLSRSQRH